MSLTPDDYDIIACDMVDQASLGADVGETHHFANLSLWFADQAMLPAELQDRMRELFVLAGYCDDDNDALTLGTCCQSAEHPGHNVDLRGGVRTCTVCGRHNP